jgi:hypothetical protein
VAGIKRWLPFELADTELRDRLRNKMIRPTSIPQTLEDLWLEQAVCREALRLSLQHHRSLAMGVGGSSSERGIADVFRQSSDRYELVDMLKLDVVIGSGGVLSHAPSRMQAALMMIDGFGLEGITQLAVDSIFMLPHLGVFASVHPDAAQEIFERDCIVYVGAAVVPRYASTLKMGAVLADILVDGVPQGEACVGYVARVELPRGARGLLSVVPRHKSVDVGAGAGNRMERQMYFGECGVIIDGRNRPFHPDSFTPGAQRQVYQNTGLISAGSY